MASGSARSPLEKLEQQAEAEKDQLRGLLKLDYVSVDRPSRYSPFGSRFSLSPYGPPSLTTIGFDRLSAISVMRADSPESLRLEIRLNAFRLGIEFEGGVLITTSIDGFASLGDRIWSEYWKIHITPNDDPHAVVALLIAHDVFRIDGVLDVLDTLSRYELIPASAASVRSSTIPLKKLRRLKEVLSLKQEFDQHLGAHEAFVRYWTPQATS